MSQPSWDTLEALQFQEYEESQKELAVEEVSQAEGGTDLGQLATYQQELIDRLLQEPPSERTRIEQQTLLHQVISETSIPGPVHFDVIESVLDDMYGYGPVQELYDRLSVTDIQIFVPLADTEAHRIQYVENGVRKAFSGRFRDKTHAINWLNNKLARIGQRFDPASMTVDGAMPDGSRIHAVYGPSGYSTWDSEAGFRLVRCLVISIRRFGKLFTPTDLTNSGDVTARPTLYSATEYGFQMPEKWFVHQDASVDIATMEYFRIIMEMGINFLIAGGTGAGKTTFGNALTTYLPAHVVTLIIEESPELQAMVPHAIRLYEDRPNYVGSRVGFSLQDALKAALRMFPDRIFIAELRDQLAYLYLRAIQSGHDGSFTTIHASNCAAALRQLMTYAKSHPDKPTEEYLTTVMRERLGMVFHLSLDKKAKAQGLATAQYVDEVVEILPGNQGVETHTVMRYERGIDEAGQPRGYFHWMGPSSHFLLQMTELGFEIPASWR
ncbi:ATPase, T2SS/T4P/T4SS family [Alicyclobacillus sp. SO9]|uniref:ATPase, T2SS/T4P/T4SS family n=1 Tax=Alicyclobacillus sp. SO9 TaxID=2665646 RepID=UPI0018E7EF0E|nr:ATPase, T2SS/T4P/T4SS family [Alicyclobacillus sp. SO9]QQE79556.1 CpaF family protein [Alicyclobacillus sp. SO9]